MKWTNAPSIEVVFIALASRRVILNKIKSTSNVVCLFVSIFTIALFYLLISPANLKKNMNLLNSQSTPSEPCPKSSLMEMSCKTPWVFPYEPDILRHIGHFGQISCTKVMPNLAFYQDETNTLTIQNDLDAVAWKKQKMPFNCKVDQLAGGLKPRASMYTMEDTGIVLGLNEQVKINKFDQFVVTCYNKTENKPSNVAMALFNDSLIYQRAFTSFAKHEEHKFRAPMASADNPSLIMLILDSTSRNQFLRHAPLSAKYMKELDFVTLNAYTKVGDNSGSNLFPVLAGRTAERTEGTGAELVEQLPVRAEDFEFIWDLMKQKGCVTMINDDIMDASRGLFAYHHHSGFEKPPVDYFFRPYSLFNVRNEVKPKLGQCTIHGQSLVNQYFSVLERMSRVFKEHCHFSITFLPTPTHDHAHQLETEDYEIRTMLEKFQAIGVLENSVVVIMGDHGNRIGTIQYTYSGRIEERMPLFSLYLPPKLQEKYPHFRANFEHNTNRLVSNYDIHQTLRTIAMLAQENSAPQFAYRGYSLLEQKVPANRSCREAAIPPNFCTCLLDKPLPRYQRESLTYSNILESIRVELSASFNTCLNLKTLKLESEEIRSLSVSPMVRQGWRSMPANKTVDYNSHMEVIYHDVQLIVTSVFDKGLQLLVRVKNYLHEKTYRLAYSPLILNNFNKSASVCGVAVSLQHYCDRLTIYL